MERYISESGGEYLASEIMQRDKAVELTEAEYEQLSNEEKNNGTTYYITDGVPSAGSGTVIPQEYDDTVLAGRVTTVEGLLDGHSVGKDIPANAVFTDTVYDDTALASRVTSNETAIQTLNGTGAGSVQKTVTDKIAEVVANAPEDFDTLKEIADYIASDKTGAAELGNAVAANTSALGGHTVGTSVPSDAEFTDTVYDDTELVERMTSAETSIKNFGYAKYTEHPSNLSDFVNGTNTTSITYVQGRMCGFRFLNDSNIFDGKFSGVWVYGWVMYQNPVNVSSSVNGHGMVFRQDASTEPCYFFITGAGTYTIHVQPAISQGILRNRIGGMSFYPLASWFYHLTITTETTSSQLIEVITTEGTIRFATSGSKWYFVSGVYDRTVDYGTEWTYTIDGLTINLNCSKHVAGYIIARTGDLTIETEDTIIPETNAVWMTNLLNLSNRVAAAENAINEKQDSLIPGDGITIASDGKTISTTTKEWVQLGTIYATKSRWGEDYALIIPDNAVELKIEANAFDWCDPTETTVSGSVDCRRFPYYHDLSEIRRKISTGSSMYEYIHVPVMTTLRFGWTEFYMKFKDNQLKLYRLEGGRGIRFTADAWDSSTHIATNFHAEYHYGNESSLMPSNYIVYYRV